MPAKHLSQSAQRRRSNRDWTESMNLKLINTVIRVRREQRKKTGKLWELVISRLRQLPAGNELERILSTSPDCYGHHQTDIQFHQLFRQYKAAMQSKGSTRAFTSPSLTEAVCRKLEEYRVLIEGPSKGPAKLHQHVNNQHRAKHHRRYNWTESMRLDLLETLIKVKRSRQQPSSTGKISIWEEVIAKLAQLPAGRGFKLILHKAELRTKRTSVDWGHPVIKQFYNLTTSYKKAAMLQKVCYTRASSRIALTESVCEKLRELRDLTNLEINSTRSDHDSYIYVQDEKDSRDTSPTRISICLGDCKDSANGHRRKSGNTTKYTQSAPDSEDDQSQRAGSMTRGTKEGLEHSGLNFREKHLEIIYEELLQISSWCKHRLVPAGIKFLYKSGETGLHENENTTSTEHPFKELVADCGRKRLKHQLQVRREDLQLKFAEHLYNTIEEMSRDVLKA